MSYVLPKLAYNYDSFEPFLDKRTMEIHHTKHHSTYIKNINDALSNTKFSDFSIYDLITNLSKIPKDKIVFVRNNAGGHFNHSFFWKCLGINTEIHGMLKMAIEDNFGSIEDFKDSFKKASMMHFGSGWVWLIKNVIDDKLSIISTTNQDNPLMDLNISIRGYPIIGLDLWEHAYYLKYQNNRLGYIEAFWNIVDWNEANKRFIKCDWILSQL